MQPDWTKQVAQIFREAGEQLKLFKMLGEAGVAYRNSGNTSQREEAELCLNLFGRVIECWKGLDALKAIEPLPTNRDLRLFLAKVERVGSSLQSKFVPYVKLFPFTPKELAQFPTEIRRSFLHSDPNEKGIAAGILLGQFSREMLEASTELYQPMMDWADSLEAGLIDSADAKPATARTKKITKVEANEKASEYLRTHPKATVRQLAAAIGCSTGLVSQLPAWKAVRRMLKEGRQPLTSKAITNNAHATPLPGQSDDELKRLVTEQENDDRRDRVSFRGARNQR